MFFSRRNSRLNGGRTQRPSRRSFRPFLEELEARITPDGSATVSNLTQLRDAITQANDNMAGVFTINVNPGTYTLLANSPLVLNNTNAGTTTIIQETPGASGQVVLDGGHVSRVLQVNAGNVIVDNVSVKNGAATDDPTGTAGLAGAAGGGLLNAGGNVSLSHVNFTSNSAAEKPWAAVSSLWAERSPWIPSRSAIIRPRADRALPSWESANSPAAMPSAAPLRKSTPTSSSRMCRSLRAKRRRRSRRASTPRP